MARPAAGQRLAACASVGPVDARDLVGRNDVFVLIPPGEDNEGRVCAHGGQGHDPPDVPDQRESHEGGEEGADEAGRAVPRHLDIRIDGLVAQRRLLDRALLHAPVGVLAFDVRQNGEIEGRRRRGGRPFQRAPIPRIAGLVAKLLPLANADGELRDLQDDPGQDDCRAARRDQQPGAPSGTS